MLNLLLLFRSFAFVLVLAGAATLRERKLYLIRIGRRMYGTRNHVNSNPTNTNFDFNFFIFSSSFCLV